MKKKYFVLMFIVFVCSLFFVNISNAYEKRVFDDAGLFSESEVTDLESKVADLIKEMNMDFAIVTANDAKGLDSEHYANETYLSKGFGKGDDKSGGLFLIDMDNRQSYIYGKGLMIRYFTDKQKEKLLDIVTPYLKKGKYYDSATAAI